MQWWQTSIHFLDLFGTFIFAVTGAVRGIHRNFDLLGVTVLACAVGVGGGIMRDCVIGAAPVMALKNEQYLLLCIATGVGVFFCGGRGIFRRDAVILWCDAVGLGVFTAIGAEKGMLYGLPTVGIILSGVLTAIGGGVIRDVLSGKVPALLKSDFYATASLLGGILFCLLAKADLSPSVIFASAAIFVTGLRILAIHFQMRLPRAREYTVFLLRRAKKKKLFSMLFF